MKYDENVGKIYDAIYYGVIYFNKLSVIKKFEERGHDLDGAFTYFDEVKNNSPPLPECLLPFFYYDAITPCFLTDYFITSLDFRKHKFKDYITVLQDTLKKCVFEYLFINLTENERNLVIQKKDSEAVGRAFKNESWTAEMLKQTMFLLYNFPYVSGLLVETLIDIYKHITELHDRYKDKIVQCIEESESRDNLILFEKMYNLSEKRASKQFFSICFMNQFVSLEKSDNNGEFIFLFGYRYKETLEADLNKKSISLQKALYILGDPVRFDIIVNLDKYGTLTMSDLCRLIDISKSTAYRGINTLFEERIIVESCRDGNKIYFKLNVEYFQLTNILFDKFVNGLNK